ncbi:hypothetical protein HPB51_018632 [Rhipicephalus microplus]|uniref:Tick transposon n=1 Tax=Rhipicephalus microplus TaxID=6941 RepID=A0A9J6F4V4_RHIMP|nr:hypothetical protein HPB51_018632 [Rhipicephalus microplus]
MRDRNLAFADAPQGDQPQESMISILIGSDHYWGVMTGRVVIDSLSAVETIFGLVLQGVAANVNYRLSSRNINATASFLACSDNWRAKVLPRDPSAIWRLDAFSVTHGQDDVSKHPVLIHFRSTVRKRAGRYEVPLMIKTPGLMSWTNRSVAETWLKHQLQWFEHHPEVAARRAGQFLP